jgi:hypothetical protein
MSSISMIDHVCPRTMERDGGIGCVSPLICSKHGECIETNGPEAGLPLRRADGSLAYAQEAPQPAPPGNIRVFPGAQLPPDLDSQPVEPLIKYLRQLLEKAESGELRIFVGTGFLRDGASISMRGGHWPNSFAMLGAIHWLEVDFVRKVIRDNKGNV